MLERTQQTVFTNNVATVCLCVHPSIPQKFSLEWRMDIIAYSSSFYKN